MNGFRELHIHCTKNEARFLITKFKESIRHSPNWTLVEAIYSNEFAQGIDIAKDLVLMVYHLNEVGDRKSCLFMSYNDDLNKSYIEVNNILGHNNWINKSTYNNELEYFRQEILQPNLSLSFNCEIFCNTEKELKNIPADSLKLLKAFAFTINWESPHHNDMERWNDFIISILKNGRPKISDSTIKDLLIEMNAPETNAIYWAERFVWEYWLLCKYDSI